MNKSRFYSVYLYVSVSELATVLLVRKKDDLNKKNSHLILKMSMNGCPDIVSLTEKFLMARNFFQIFTENNPARAHGEPDKNIKKPT